MRWFMWVFLTVFVSLFSILALFTLSGADTVSPQVLAASTTKILQNQPVEIVEINKVRSAYGASGLEHDPRLEVVARTRVNEMVLQQYYAHERTDGTYFDSLIPDNTPKTYSCENLQLQHGSSIQQAITAWENSPPHRQCMTSNSLVHAAVVAVPYTTVDSSFGSEEMYIFAFIATN